MDRRIEDVSAFRDDNVDVLVVLSTVYGKSLINELMPLLKCTAIVLIPQNSFLYLHRTEVE